MPRSFLPPILRCLIVIYAAALLGCAQNAEIAPDAMKAFHAGNLSIAKNEDAPQTIFITVRGADSELLAKDLEQALLGSRFRIADSPSKAGYILHLDLVQEGSVNPALFRDLVDRGYGKEARFSGGGASGIIMDALLVQRRVPRSNRPSRVRLNNISARNALDNSRMRVGILLEKPKSDSAYIRRLFMEKIAAEVRASLANAEINAASAK